MTIQQMRYIAAIAELGSISAAAKSCFVTQPTLSGELKKLEEELDINIFERGRSGIVITDQGKELIGYITNILEQIDYVQEHYQSERKRRCVFSVASHHSSFVSEAFMMMTKNHESEDYHMKILEVQTKEIISNVSGGFCDMGILVKGNKNKILDSEIDKAFLEFHILTASKPHVFLHKNHPLADRESLNAEDLKDYPLMVYDQGMNSLKYYAEETIYEMNRGHIIVLTDRDTEINLSKYLQAYTFGSGKLSKNTLLSDTVCIPFESDKGNSELIQIGWISRKDKVITSLMKEFIQYICEILDIENIYA